MAAVKFNRSGRGRNKQVLRYPLKMFTAGTDYLQIDMLDYTPVARADGEEAITETKFGKDEDGKVTEKTYDTGRTRTKYSSYAKDTRSGFRRNGNKQPLGTILLPIPSNIQDGNSVNYTDDSMNSLVGAGLGAAEGIMTNVGRLTAQGKFGDIPGAVRDQVVGALNSSGLTLGNAQDLATKYLAGQALGIFGGNVSINQLLARQSGQVFNPNMELLFNGPTLRNFNFTFKMMPRSSDEAEEIKHIIRFFKRGMAPKAGSGNLFLKTPNVFELRYRQGNGEHQFLHRFKQCFLENISVNYTGEGVYSTYDDGTPVSMEMTLAFKELAPIYDIDYDSELGFAGPYADPNEAVSRETNPGQGGVGY